MSARGFVFLLVVLLVPLHPPRAETTYGETRAVPKREAPSCDRPARTDAAAEGDREDDDGAEDQDFGKFYFDDFDVHRGLAGTCFALRFQPHSLGGLGFAPIVFPLWWAGCGAVYGLIQGPVHLAIGNHAIEAAERPAWRASGGMAVGADWVPSASGGPGAGLHLEATGPLDGAGGLELRLRAAAAGAAQGLDVDYARSVFFDGKPAGLEYDRMLGYSVESYPLTAELLWHPGRRGFYLSAGGGLDRRDETIRFERSTPVPGGSGFREESRQTWDPIACAALGRDALDGAGRPRWYFEIRGQAESLRPLRRSSFPSDNAFSAFSVAWVWGWYL